MTKKKELSPELKTECDAAKALFISRKNALGLTQAKLAEAAEISPAGVAMYLNGVNPLNAKFAVVLARLIGEPVSSFSPRLAAEIAGMASATTRSYQGALYEAAPADQRADVDEVAEKMLRLTPEQARKLKQAMDLLIPDHAPGKS